MFDKAASGKALRLAIREGFQGLAEELRTLTRVVAELTDALKTDIELRTADRSNYDGEING